MVQQEKTMPHVSIKMFPGRSEEQKARLAEEVTKAVMKAIGCPDSSLSVTIEDVAPDRRTETVYNPEIRDKPASIYKKPGYSPS
jgi:4-oxalocrotonate tautomerase